MNTIWPPIRRLSRRTGRVITAVVLMFVWDANPPIDAQSPRARALLYQDSRGELAQARARGDAAVILLLAARDGAVDEAVKVIAAAGGAVQYRADDVGYVRARVPTGRVETLLESEAFETAAVDASAGTTNRPFFASPSDVPEEADPGMGDNGPFRDATGAPRPGQTAGAQSLRTDDGWPPRWSDYPLRKPYSPIADLGAAELRRRHPSYDGRGVTIGHVEAGIDLLLPEFEAAYTLDGRAVPKIADYFTATDPDHDHGEDNRRNAWASMTTEVTATGGRFAIKDETYTAPRDGRFRFGTFIGTRLCQNLKKRDPNAPPPPPPSPSAPDDPDCRFGVLWAEDRQEIWLDTDRDRNFVGERAMRDFRHRRDVGTIGRDEPDSPERESFSFTVQVHPRTKAVAINVGNAGHATMVAGSAAGSRGTRGLYDGVAPGAQLVVIDYGGMCAAGFIEATIAAFKDPRVDIVLFEQNAFIALPYRVGDGRFTPSLVTTRLIAKYQKPFVVPGDNVPGLNVTSEHGNVRWGFAVGAYESKDSYRTNDGYLVQRQDNLHHVGAWGPGGDGAVKPDILAPSGYLSSELPTATRRGGVKGLFRLPPGYGIGGGTSQATPTMAGALALLISAAKQEKVPYDAERIWRAMTGSARFLPDIPAHKQGNGVINVEAALALLRTYARTPPLSIISRGPVRTPVSAWLETPHQGVGLFERDGWKPGQRGERTLTLRRTTGPREPLTFGISWLGNDGTFAAPSSVSLPLGTAVPVRIAVGPGNAGPHSALLTLDHPSTPGPDYRVMAAVVASEGFAADDKFVRTKKDKLERPGPSTSYFLDVPPGVDAFTTTLTGGRVGLHDPIGRESRGGSAPAKIVRRPMPGVWEAGVSITNDSLDLLWTENPDAVAPPAFYTLTTTLLGATVETDGRLALPPGGSQTIEVSVTNRYGSFDGGLTPLPLAAVRTARDRLGPREQRVFEITVPDGCPWLLAEANGSGDGAIDLYVFDCTGKRCVAAASAVGHGMSPVVRHPSPKAGLWKVVVDSALVAGNGTSVEYMDAILDPSLGGVAAADAARTRDPGARWSSPVSVWLLKPPAAGRVPHAVLGVVTTVEGQPVPVGFRLVAIEAKHQTNVSADKYR